MLNSNSELKVRIGRGNPQPRGVRPAGVTLALLLVLVVGGGTVGTRDALAQQPDYGQVNDFLYGLRHILRDDDLIVNFAGTSYDCCDSLGKPILQYFFGRSFALTSSNSQLSATDPVFPAAIKYQTSGCPVTSGCGDNWTPYWYAPSLTPVYSDSTVSSHLAVGNVAGRFFNTDRDTFVQFPFQIDPTQNPLLIWFNSDNNGLLAEASNTGVGWVIGANNFITKVGDFNGDGYDDLLLGASNGANYKASFMIATATDVNDPTKGFTLGPQFQTSLTYGIRDVAVGDFGGGLIRFKR